TLNLRNTNTFTGGVQVWGGTLDVDADDRLGAAANNVSLLGGTFQVSVPTATLTTGRSFTLGTTGPLNLASTPINVFAVTSGTTGLDLTINSVLSGPGGFAKTGAQKLILSGFNPNT